MNIQDLLLEWAQAEPEICQYEDGGSFATVHGKIVLARDYGEVFRILRLAMKKKKWLWQMAGKINKNSANVWNHKQQGFYFKEPDPDKESDPLEDLFRSYLKAVSETTDECTACKRREGADTLDCIECGGTGKKQEVKA